MTMSIVHFSTADGEGGSARSAHRIHSQLRGRGHQSRMLVKYKVLEDDDIDTVSGGRLLQFADRVAEGVTRRVGLQYQFMPFFKAAFGINPTYSSIGQYLVAYVTGQVIEGPFTFPNSNLILETMFTSGNGLGYVLYLSELLIFYFVRRRALSRPVTPGSLLALKVTVFSPLSMFLSGQEYFTTLVISAFILWGCYALWVLVRKEPGKAVAVASVPGGATA